MTIIAGHSCRLRHSRVRANPQTSYPNQLNPHFDLTQSSLGTTCNMSYYYQEKWVGTLIFRHLLFYWMKFKWVPPI